ncbi:VWA-like domain-containing protein [Streptosporangium sp. NPDC023615]|uniref:vWA domain-containing protein n=1 Tax=Streptosporangium sp. NPDC023615 TaxID=3154794 RepID=UPI003424CCF1
MSRHTSTSISTCAARLGVWVHEVSHLLRDHHGRGDRVAAERGPTGPGERLRMNIAADFEINDDVYGDGLVRPEGAVEPRALGLPEGEFMEGYLRRFRLGPYTQSMVWLDCGSGADGLEREWELGPDGANGLSPQARDAVRFRVAQGINARPGNAPPRVSVVVDTSGSVSDAELGSALLEVAAIVRAVGGRRDLVGVLSCDAAAQAVHGLCHAGGIALVGGGGTDLRTGFAAALRARPRPDVVVVLTDGQTPWPDARPPCRTVMGLFPRAGSSGTGDEDDPDHVPDAPPEWARVVAIG